MFLSSCIYFFNQWTYVHIFKNKINKLNKHIIKICNLFIIYNKYVKFIFKQKLTISTNLLLDSDFRYRHLTIQEDYENPPKSLKRVARKQKKIKLEPKPIEETADLNYSASSRGNNMLFHLSQKYIRNNIHGDRIYWKCSKWHSGCKGRAITLISNPIACVVKNKHNHDIQLPE